MARREEPFGFEEESFPDNFTVTDQGKVAIFYVDKLGRYPTQFEARSRLDEELMELEVALNGGTDEAVIHEMVDVMYTLYGYAISRGWNLPEAFDRVHAANMTKDKTDSGKVKKGAGFIPADLTDLVGGS